MDLLRVLLIEHDTDHALQVLLTVAADGDKLMRLRRVSSLREALHHITRVRPDAVLFSLGGVEGTSDSLRRLIAACATPVLALVDDDGEASRESALGDGAVDCLIKRQFDHQHLYRAVRYAMAQKQCVELKEQLARAERQGIFGQAAAELASELDGPANALTANTQELERTLEILGQRAGPSGGGAQGSQTLANPAATPAWLDAMARLTQDTSRQIVRLRAAARHFRALSRVGGTQIQAVDVNQLVQAAVQQALGQLDPQVALALDLKPLPRIHADAETLAAVIANLLKNAIEALQHEHGAKSEILISTRAQGGEITLSVEDTGPGIRANVLPLIFEPFFTTKLDAEGTGLGLALCREAIRMHGGTIQAHNRPGGGACLKVSIPEDTGLEPPHAGPARVTLQPTRRARVLLVDDDLLVRTSCAGILGTQHDVRVLASCREAQELVRRDQSFDVIFCGLMMSEGDGREFFEFLCAEHPKLSSRVVFLSGGAFTRRANELLLRVDNLCIPKPLDTELLLRVAAELAQRADKSA